MRPKIGSGGAAVKACHHPPVALDLKRLDEAGTLRKERGIKEESSIAHRKSKESVSGGSDYANWTTFRIRVEAQFIAIGR